MCGAPTQTPTLPAHIDLTKETVIYGRVLSGEQPVASAYVRLLDADEEFTGEVVSSATGDFRFFARPGRWTLSVLHRNGATRKQVVALEPGLVEADLQLS